MEIGVKKIDKITGKHHRKKKGKRGKSGEEENK